MGFISLFSLLCVGSKIYTIISFFKKIPSYKTEMRPLHFNSSISKNIHFPGTFEHHLQRMPRALSCSPPVLSPCPLLPLLTAEDGKQTQQSSGLWCNLTILPIHYVKRTLAISSYQKRPILVQPQQKKARDDAC